MPLHADGIRAVAHANSAAPSARVVVVDTCVEKDELALVVDHRTAARVVRHVLIHGAAREARLARGVKTAATSMRLIAVYGAAGKLHGAEAVDEAAAREFGHPVGVELGVARDHLGVLGDVHAAAVSCGVGSEGAAFHLHRPALQGRAATRIVRCVAHDRDIGHRERLRPHVHVDASAVLRLVAQDRAAGKRHLAVGAEASAEVARLVVHYDAASSVERTVGV